MTKNTVRIRDRLTLLTRQPFELMSGKVVAGTVDTTANTLSVMTTNGAIAIDGVMMTSVTNGTDGLIMVPKEECDVVIGCIDGPGQWVVLAASELTKMTVKTEQASFIIEPNGISFANGESQVDIGELIKMSTAGESLHTLLSDLITAITLITVSTPSGPSSIPANVATFNSLLTRLNNLLSA
jgi:hypothetical protein